MSGASHPGVQPGAIPNAMGGNLSALLGALKNAQPAQPSMPQARYYQTTLEPMQMLQSYRAGQPVVNPVFAPQQQFLPPALAPYTPKPAAAPVFTPFDQSYGAQMSLGGSGDDGGAGAAAAGNDGAGGEGGGSGGGGGGGGK